MPHIADLINSAATRITLEVSVRVPDIDWWLKFMQIMRTTAVVFGHVEHDVIDLIDKK